MIIVTFFLVTTLVKLQVWDTFMFVRVDHLVLFVGVVCFDGLVKDWENHWIGGSM